MKADAIQTKYKTRRCRGRKIDDDTERICGGYTKQGDKEQVHRGRQQTGGVGEGAGGEEKRGGEERCKEKEEKEQRRGDGGEGKMQRRWGEEENDAWGNHGVSTLYQHVVYPEVFNGFC